MEPEALPIDLVPLEVPATPPGLPAAVECNGIMVVRLAPPGFSAAVDCNGIMAVRLAPPGLSAAVDCNGIMVVRLAPSVKTHVEPHNGVVMIAPVAEGSKVPVDEGSAVMYDSVPIGGYPKSRTQSYWLKYGSQALGSEAATESTSSALDSPRARRSLLGQIEYMEVILPPLRQHPHAKALPTLLRQEM